MDGDVPPAGGLRRPLEDPAYQALREGDLQSFSALTSEREDVDFRYCDLGGVDLRKVNISNIRLRGARLKGSDLRGLDLSHHDLEGVTIRNARISGTLFPRDLTAAEVRLSLQEGTRIRHGKG
jgi:uncharacterized protein YjbI with pentapeptide repeats